MNVDFDVELAKAGDEEAILRLLKKHEASMYRIANTILKSREDCEDAMQNTIIKAYRSIAGLKDTNYFKTWITRILINESCRLIKHRKRELPLISEFIDYFSSGSDLCEGSYEFEDVENLDLKIALESLGKDLRLVVVLYYFDGFEIKEISKVTGIAEGTVKSRLSRARAQLREKLDNGYGRRGVNETQVKLFYKGGVHCE